MSLDQLVVVSDAHLGAAPGPIEDAFLAFLHELPRLGDGLLINGDLFHFWFGQRDGAEAAGSRVIAAIGELAGRVPVAMTGGNRDRWGEPGWQRSFGVRFDPHELRLEVAGARVLAVHGDCVPEDRWIPRIRHRMAALPITSAVYRALPRNLGPWLVHRLAKTVFSGRHDEAAIDRSARRQLAWAERRLAEEADVRFLVMGHTHRATTVELSPGSHYLNPGAWLDGCQYGVVTRAGVTLTRFPG